MRRTPLIATLLCLASAALAGAADGDASLKMTLKGTDETTWSYHVEGITGCHGEARNGIGHQTIRYASVHSFVNHTEPSLDGLLVPTPASLAGVGFPVPSTITRESTETGCRRHKDRGRPDCGIRHFSLRGNLRSLPKARLGFSTTAASLKKKNDFNNCPNSRGDVGAADNLGVGPGRAHTARQEALFHSGGKRYAYAFRSIWTATFRRIHASAPVAELRRPAGSPQRP